jgi:hypothetical protein
MSIVRSDDASNWVDDLGRFYQRDRGIDNDATIIWRNNASDYILDMDNGSGNHANFGSGKFLVTDSDVGAYTFFTMHQANVLQFKNAADTNIANFYHSGTNDLIKSDDSLLMAGSVNAGPVTASSAAGSFFGSGALNMGATALATTAGDASIQHALSVGATHSPTNVGEIYGSLGISVGTYSAPAAGEGRFSAAVGVGIVPTSPLHVSFAKSAGILANLAQTSSSAGSKGLAIDSANTTATDYVFQASVATVPALDVWGSGYVQAATRLGVGIAPTHPFHVATAFAGDWLAWIEQTDSGSSSRGLYVKVATTNAGAHVLYAESAGNARLAVFADGGVVVGSLGSQGAGTLNVQNNIYKSGSAYTNPSYALEHWSTGQIVVHADKEGAQGYRRPDLDEAERYIRRHYELPGHLPSFGLFDGGDWLLEKLEEAWTYILELHHRIEALEAA